MLVAAAVALLVEDLPVAVDIVIWLVLFREVIVAAATIVLAIAGARRIDVVWAGKAGTLAVMFALPLFLWADAIDPGFWRAFVWFAGWCFAISRARARVLRRRQVRARGARGAARRAATRTGSRACGELECGGARMKAVILAGGEGTRLRPLTSNQPKPMMPIANVPMMEHIVRLLARARLRRHRRDGCVPRQPHPQLLRRRLRLRRAACATPRKSRRSAPRVRCATRWTSSTRRSSSSPATCSPTSTSSAFVEAHRNAAGVRVDRAEAGREPGRVRHRDHPRRRLDRALPREAHVGRGVLRHDQHRDLRARTRRLRPHPRGRGRRLLRRRVPERPRERRQALRPRRSTGTGRTSARSRRTATAHEDILDGRVEIDVPGFHVRDGVWLGENVDVSPDVVVEGPVLIGDNCRIEAGAVLRPYTVLGDDVVVKADAHIERTRRARPRLPRARRRVCAARCSGARATSATACASRKASSSATSRSSVRDAIINPSVKIYPFKSVDPGALVTSSIVWESTGRAHAVRPPRRARPRQRRHHRRRSRCASRWRTAPR